MFGTMLSEATRFETIIVEAMGFEAVDTVTPRGIRVGYHTGITKYDIMSPASAENVFQHTWPPRYHDFGIPAIY